MDAKDRQDKEDGQLDPSLVDEIDKAAVAPEKKEEKQEPEKKLSGDEGGRTPPGGADDNKGDKADGRVDDVDGKDKGEKKDNAITDELVERAVKAGLSLSDAKSFPSKESLERVCTSLESRTKADDKSGDGGKTDKATDEDRDPAEGIPDLDPERYDDAIVAGFKVMKGLISAQHKTIQEMRKDGATARSASDFESQLAAKGDVFSEALGKSPKDASAEQAKARADLEAKFNFLKKAYKAEGAEVGDADVFEEAAAIVLGGEIAKLKDDQKREKLEKRSNLHIQRPSKSTVQPASDAFAETAAEIDAKFNKKP